MTSRTGAAAAAFTCMALAVTACGSGTAPGAATAASGSSSSSSTSGAGKTLTIGAIASLSGPASVYGQEQVKGFNLAIDRLNARGGVNGAKLKLIVADDGSTPSQGAQAVQKLVQSDNVTAILGPTLSAVAVAADPVAADLKTPIMGVSLSGTGIVGPGCGYCSSGYIFRDSLGEASAIPGNLAIFRRSHPQDSTAAILAANDDTVSKDQATVFKQAAARSGVRIVSDVSFSATAPDLSPFVAQAIASKPSMLLVGGVGPVPIKLVLEARQAGYTGQILGTNGFNIPAVIKAIGSGASGIQVGTAYYGGATDHSNAVFSKIWTAKYGTPPDQFAAQAFTGILIFADALKRAGLTYSDLPTDRTKFRNALATTSLTSTPIGAFHFTPTHDVSQTVWVVKYNAAGKTHLVGSVPAS